MSIFTATLYELYWSYQNWKRIKAASGEKIRPFWRAFFAPLWNFALFKRIHAAAGSSGVPVAWSATPLAALYLLMSAAWRLPDPWWWASMLSFLPMIPVQKAAQRVNERHAAPNSEPRNERYSGLNIATIVIVGLLLILALIGTFMPE